jgi:hypothetical protein
LAGAGFRAVAGLAVGKRFGGVDFADDAGLADGVDFADDAGLADGVDFADAAGFADEAALAGDDFADVEALPALGPMAAEDELRARVELARFADVRFERFFPPMGSASPTFLAAPLAISPTFPASLPAVRPTFLTTLPGSGIGVPSLSPPLASDGCDSSRVQAPCLRITP